MNPTSNNKITGFSLLPPSVVNKDKNNVAVNASYHASVEFIQRAGLVCKLPMKTINTAIMIFLRYFASCNNCIDDENSEYSINDICRCALFSASKIEETPCRLRDIMNATFKITFPDQPLPNPNTTDWHKWKDNLIKLESIILNEINFEFNAVHPHQFVLHQCNELKTSINIAKLAWSICNDCLYSRNIMLSYKPHQISASAIYIAAEFLSHTKIMENHTSIGIDDNSIANHNINNINNINTTPTSPIYHHVQHHINDGTKETNWWKRFDIDDDILQTICCLIMDLYESPFAKFKDDDEHKENNNIITSEDQDDDLKIIKTPSPPKNQKIQNNNNNKQMSNNDRDNEDNDIKM